MPLIYVTGPSGSGKSTACKELRERGFQAYDTDDHTNDWFNKATGFRTEYPSSVEGANEEWLSQHDFIMSEDKIKTLASHSHQQNIFVCGLATNDIDLFQHFDMIICLVISKELMEERVSMRQNNTWGHQPHQLAIMKQWYSPTIARYMKAGAEMIDASLPKDKVVDEIVRLAKINI